MNTPLTLRRSAHSRIHARRAWRLLPWLAFAALVAWVAHLSWPYAAAGEGVDNAITASPLVRWQDAEHDWLLVVDRATRELVVYDARDGRPLRRLGAASGAGAIDSITGAGNSIIATNRHDHRMKILNLPDLRPASLATR